MLETFVRPSEMKALTGQAISSTYADAKKGLLPPPVKIGKRASGFVAREVAAVQHARIRGASEAEIKALVTRLVAQRTAPPEGAQ